MVKRFVSVPHTSETDVRRTSHVTRCITILSAKCDLSVFIFRLLSLTMQRPSTLLKAVRPTECATRRAETDVQGVIVDQFKVGPCNSASIYHWLFSVSFVRLPLASEWPRLISFPQSADSHSDRGAHGRQVTPTKPPLMHIILINDVANIAVNRV